MIYSLSDDVEMQGLDEIKALESRIGKTLLAFSELPKVEADAVSDADLAAIRQLEKKLGVVLVAVNH